MSELWVGVDAGKRAHHCVAIDAAGAVVLSKRVDNDESALLDLIAAVLTMADGDPVVWATDLNTGGPALLIAVLEAHGQQVLYIPGRIVHHAAATYRGDGKTDLLTELSGRSFGRCVRGSTGLARFASHDRRRGCAAGVLRVGGAAAGVARGDRRSVRAVSAR
ncbi:transposase [Rhodococcus wratislaviensis IFP 2016]|nr:transposase [Rhodococcus wratislaviensis IFP 2016]